MDDPTLDEVLKYIGHVPCSETVEKILLTEISSGNKLVNVGDVGFSPSETVVMVLFKEEPKHDYLGIEIFGPRNSRFYKRLCMCDNHGAVEIRFGGNENE